jgi:hypothetical protein
MYYKVEIFPKNEGFVDELIVFLLEKSPQFRRSLSIDNILNKESPLKNIEYLKKLSPIPLDEKYGSTFQSHYRNNAPSYISHTIHSIFIDNKKFYANIELWRLDYNELMILRPVYQKEGNEYKIGTFDIDYDINNNAA